MTGYELIETAALVSFDISEIGSLRRDCLDHVIAINQRQLRSVVQSYVDYYHQDRTHLAKNEDHRFHSITSELSLLVFFAPQEGADEEADVGESLEGPQ